MQPSSSQDYRTILTEVIRKQMAILGPGITLSKARGVAGLTIDDTGNITNIAGDPQMVMQALVDQFVQLSGLIVRKTMEPLLMYHTNPDSIPTSPTATPALTTPILDPVIPAPTQSMPLQQPKPTIKQPVDNFVQPSIPAAPVIETPHLDNPTPQEAQLSKGPRSEEIQKIIDEALSQK